MTKNHEGLSLTLTRSALSKALGHLHRIVDKRNTIPILANVLLTATGDGLRVAVTNLDVEGIENVAAAEVLSPGATTVPAQMLFDIIRKIPEGANVSLKIEDEARAPHIIDDGYRGTLVIRSGRSKFKLRTLPAEDFPTLATEDVTHRFTVASAAFNRLLSASFAASTEDTRYYLNGVFLHAHEAPHGPMLRGVATNGVQLAWLQMDAPDGVVGMPGVILPRKAVTEITKMLADVDTVLIEMSKVKARFTFGDVVFTTKLVDGTFPDYLRVIPTAGNNTLIVDRVALVDAIERVSTLSTANGKAVRLAIADNKVTLSVNNPDSGSASDEIDADYDALPIDIGFSARYLIDVLSHVPGDKARMRIIDSTAPVLIESETDINAQYVLMSMRH